MASAAPGSQDLILKEASQQEDQEQVMVDAEDEGDEEDEEDKVRLSYLVWNKSWWNFCVYLAVLCFGERSIRLMGEVPMMMFGSTLRSFL